ncbi:unnamed protein product, partial [Brachionus calyciflorus]
KSYAYMREIEYRKLDDINGDPKEEAEVHLAQMIDDDNDDYQLLADQLLS